MTISERSAHKRRHTAILFVLLGVSALLWLSSYGPMSFAQEITKRRGFSIKITQPTNKDFVLGKTRIAADVKIDRPEAIEKVEFFVGDTLIFIDQEPPYECFYDFGQESKESVIRAVATHREGITVSDFIVTRKLSLSFSVRVDRVVLNASVYDKDGYAVSGLGRDDFVVREEGAARQIVDFAHDERPILMGILIDVSGSMQEKLDEAQTAATGFVDTLRDVDRAMLVEFSEKVFMLSDLSNDRPALKRMILSTKALGGTGLYDAIHSTLRRLSKFDSRKAVVVLSDGDDTHSQTDFKALLEEAKTHDATIYAIGLAGVLAEGRGRLRDLAEGTGGRFLPARKASDLANVYTAVANDLRNQYYLTYASDNEKFDGRWIPITIEAKQKGLEVRSRKGYFAVPRSEG